MNTNQNPEPLDEAFDLLRRLPVPERPAGADAQLLVLLANGPSPAASPPPSSEEMLVLTLTSEPGPIARVTVPSFPW